jgi:hypothetical protein
LRDRGYLERQNLVVEWRLSGGDATRWLPLARELAALKVDAIVVETGSRKKRFPQCRRRPLRSVAAD